MFFAKKKINFFIEQIIIVLFFTILYYINETYFENKSLESLSFKDNSEITFFNCLHFSLVTQTTVGYGNFSAVKPVSKVINVCQLFCVLGKTLLFFY